ncbi:1-phosphatidylinositol 4,5-bisphosphate phosphodiesterase beta-1-like [Corticium candelabrum]|uniref:1-phosphatidylinositol 4,5-bisphosphate phosphodiesterase beta-1-like n=1 Tax=Corticium candelabrum TaxID=121492 RepID=UPI002E275CCD|nr:1-phosphatidylinositol 4,5-bisphosphate phosphodiesterase beta-1-like [Corticium candelabrum]
MSSLSETTAAAHLKQNPVEFVNYNKRQLTRVYPKGSRYDSSNYMPQVFWNTGCQIVALNFQTYARQTFSMLQVVVPELAMLRFAVYDDGNRFVSQRVIPLTAIQAGYRHIPLRNELNQPIDYATLFVLFEVSDYIPDGMADFLAALSNPIAYQSAVQKRAKQLEELYDDDEEQEGGGKQLPTASTCSIPNETDPKSSKLLSTSFSSNLTTSDAGSPESYDIRNAYTLTRDSSDASNKIQSLKLNEAEATTSKESHSLNIVNRARTCWMRCKSSKTNRKTRSMIKKKWTGF